MNRFGDDLTEEVLQYLTFEDKIRLECVSKQWQRCVYQRQYVIEIDVFISGNNQNSLNELFRRIEDERQSDEQRVVSVLEQCPNITKVILERVPRGAVHFITYSIFNEDFDNYERFHEMYEKLQDYQNNFTNDLSFLEEFGEKKEELKYLLNSNRYAFNSSVLSLIGQYCPRIKSLDITMTGEEVLDFFRDYGHKLQDLCLKEPVYVDFYSFPINDYLKFSSNVKKILIYNETFLLNDDKNFFAETGKYSKLF